MTTDTTFDPNNLTPEQLQQILAFAKSQGLCTLKSAPKKTIEEMEPQILSKLSEIKARTENPEQNRVKFERVWDLVCGVMDVWDWVLDENGKPKQVGEKRSVPRDCCTRNDQDQYEKPADVRAAEGKAKSDGKKAKS